ncbi:MAG: MFS transporter [Actinomycetes bacterium]|jgi:MFS family permease
MKIPRVVAAGGRFPRLLHIRWLGQITDGIFQSALASFVLFSPERQSNAVAAALAFAVVLLPYSLVGPFAGVFLDRFPRQRIVQLANFFRAADLIVIAILVKSGATGLLLTLFVLIAFGTNRLILAGLSAGLPLLVSKTELIAANALAVTGGTIGVVIGGGIGIGIKNFLDKSHGTDISDSLLIVLACLGYLASGVITSRLKRNEIGPIEQIPSTAGWREMSEGFNLLKEHGDALRGILATAFQRGGLTALTLMGLLLERNHYHSPNNPDAGLRGFAIALGIAGVGVGLGSIISPFGVMKMGRHRWIRLMMVGATPALILFAFSTKEIFLVVAAFFVGLCGQAVKVTNDALVQSKIEDEYRGRVFAFYDVAVNGAIVLGAIVAAFVLPKTGNSALLPLLITALYSWVAIFLLRPRCFSAR